MYKRGITYYPPVNIYFTAKIGTGSNIGMFAEIGEYVKVGERCKIGGHAFIPRGVTIGNEVFIGPHVMFCNDKHPKAVGVWDVTPTLVCDRASIGANSTILPGLRIGCDAVVGAGSVVTKDIPDGETWYGNPATKREAGITQEQPNKELEL